ncbi:flavocytochrome c [Sulfurospirillum sp. UCH001]|uniref:flavocytochrome c n=1 Tax=Sulfurospirillum sp. UCH001 TaxID=1581011 RepID=UPI0008367F78|nr:flavocytochrome c [Sulfurospirillum sp. UCH001]
MSQETMSRRDALKFGMMGAGAAMLAASNAMAAAPTEKDVKFDEEYDVIVIGSGFAGLAAAAKAAERGYKILILEKMGRVGGNSAINGGAFAVPMNKDQKQFGIQDSKELFIKDALKAGLGINHVEMLELIADRAQEVFDFTVKCGAKYQTGKKPTHFGGHSVARTIVTENMSGSAIIQPMAAFVEKLPGCKLLTRAKMDDFVMSNDGTTVIGVTARINYRFDNKLYSDDRDNKSGEKKVYRAKKGVVLASGGFSMDKDFRQIQDPRMTPDMDATNHDGATAGALLKAFQIGALPVHISWIQEGPWASPDERGFGVAPLLTQQGLFVKGIAVDIRNGKRFMNEMADRKTRADAEYVILREAPKAYPVAIGTYNTFDEQIFAAIDKGLQGGVMKKFDTIDALAANYKIPADALKATIAKYNEDAKNGVVDEFKKQTLADMKGKECIEMKGPFYAIRLVPKPHHTMGGLKINTKAQVISANTNKPIPGLFAAGEVTGGTHGASRLGSCAIADCLVCGFVAGENI